MIHRIVIGAALTLSASALWAADGRAVAVDYGLRAGVSYTDNVFRAPNGAEEDSGSAFAGLQLNGARPNGRLRYSLGVDLTASEYFNADVSQRLQGRAALQGSYDLVPEAFAWNASVNYDQFRENLLQAQGPGNTDEVVSFSTGPTLQLSLSEQMKAIMDATYSRVGYSDRPHDSETLGGRVSLMRQVSGATSLGLGASRTDVSYLHTLPGLVDYNRREAFLRTEVRGARTEISVETGYSQIKDDNDSTSDGLMFRGHAFRRLTPSFSASVDVVRQYAISGLYEGTTNSVIGPDGDETPVTVGARLTKTIGIGLQYQRLRTGASLNLSRHKEDGSFSGAGERTYDEFRGRVTREFTPYMQGAVDAVFSHEDLEGFSSAANERRFGADLGWKIGRTLGLWLRVDHSARDGVTAGGDYSEFSGSLYLSYGRGSGSR